MRAVTWQGSEKIEVKTVPDPEIQEPTDMIIRVTSTAICGSDLHLYHNGGLILEEDYIIGHEPMGIVEEVGKDVKKVKKGDRVVIPFTISCGDCYYCTHDMESQCDRSNADSPEDFGGIFGYGKLNGSYPGAQAEYLRVPFADSTSFVLPDNHIPDEKVLFLSDVIPTAYWSVENSGVKEGDTVIVLGSGPIGLMTQKFAKMKGAKRVIAVDNVDHRLEMAKSYNDVETYNFNNVLKAGIELYEATHGGADVVIDCVGMDGVKPVIERARNLVSTQTGTITPIITASECVRKFGTIQLTGVYLSPASSFPLNVLFSRNITVKQGQTPVQHLMPKLYKMIEEEKFDPTTIITHTMPLESAPTAYEIFDKKKDNNVKVILKPH